MFIGCCVSRGGACDLVLVGGFRWFDLGCLCGGYCLAFDCSLREVFLWGFTVLWLGVNLLVSGVCGWVIVLVSLLLFVLLVLFTANSVGL